MSEYPAPHGVVIIDAVPNRVIAVAVHRKPNREILIIVGDPFSFHPARRSIGFSKKIGFGARGWATIDAGIGVHRRTCHWGEGVDVVDGLKTAHY